MAMDTNLKQQIENTLSYNDKGTTYKIIEVETVPHIIYYDDYPINKLFIEYYCVVFVRNAFESCNKYYQITYDTDTKDFWVQNLGRL